MRWIRLVTGVFHTRPVAAASWPRYSAVRAACWVAGTVANSFRASFGVAMSTRGITQPGVRWKTFTLAAVFTSSGMIWMALAPVPMTATFLPVRS